MVDIGTGNHGPVNYIEKKIKCRHLKKLTCKGTSLQVVICLRPSPSSSMTSYPPTPLTH
jgi:hypothetical protein